MMNLDEILRGIGQQMSRVGSPWQDGALQPQLQNPSPAPNMGPWGQAASSMFPEARGGVSPFPESGAGSGPFPEQGGGFYSFPERADLQRRQQDALGHIGAVQAAVSGKGAAAANDQEVEQYIRQAAAARHIDPDVAIKVWSGEGKSSYAGDMGSSFGPYQLHYGNVAGGGNAVGGLGDAFTKATGLDARDPSTWQAQVDWSLNHAAQSGWGPWHGYSGNAYDGIGTYNSPAQTAPGAQGSSDWVQKLESTGHKLGEAYDWGGKGTNGRGFDCSGLVGSLTTGQPESTVTLHGKSQAINEQQAAPGDLVFWNMNDPDPHMQHVAIYLGGGKVLQSGGTQRNINIGDAHQAIGSAPEFRRLAGG